MCQLWLTIRCSGSCNYYDLALRPCAHALVHCLLICARTCVCRWSRSCRTSTPVRECSKDSTLTFRTRWVTQHLKRAGTKLNKSKSNDLMVHVTPPSSLLFLWIDVGLNHKIHCYVSGSNLMALMELVFITDTGSNLLLLYLKEHSGNATPPCSARAILKLWCFIMFLL